MSDSPTKKQIVKNDQAFTFRAPSARDMMNIGLTTRQLNGGPDMPQDMTYRYADQVATLTVLCESPKDYDFGTLLFTDLDELCGEVMDWVNSFRRPVQPKPADVGAGASE